ncbi:MAG: hypothetical protein V7629_00480 [Motiliproteus sp.]
MLSETIKSVFLIKTPLQYLNALEALNQFDLKPSDALLILLADKKSLPQLQSLVRSEHDWGGVVRLLTAPLLLTMTSVCRNDSEIDRTNGSKTPFANALFAVLKLSFLAASLPALRYVALGDLGNPLMRHFANSIHADLMLLLDDGVATLKYARQRQDSSANLKPLRRAKRITLYLKRALLGLKDKPLGAVTFFSVYDIKVAAADRYVRNSFAALRQQACAVEQDDRVYFLGSPLVEADILSDEECFSQLKAVDDAVAGAKEILYIAHRRESPERVQRLCASLGWESQLFDYPIEYQLAIVGPKPAVLASFVSSALPNCRLIFGETLQICAYRLSPEYFSKQSSEVGSRIDAVYKEYEQLADESFKVVTL